MGELLKAKGKGMERMKGKSKRSHKKLKEKIRKRKIST